MAENSVLQMVMLEEYARLLRLINGIEAELKELPKGYISKKQIRNKESYYLQWRDGDKVRSKYISGEKIEEMREKVAKRQSLEKSLRSHKHDKKRIEVALGQSFIQQNLSQIM